MKLKLQINVMHLNLMRRIVLRLILKCRLPKRYGATKCCNIWQLRLEIIL